MAKGRFAATTNAHSSTAHQGNRSGHTITNKHALSERHVSGRAVGEGDSNANSDLRVFTWDELKKHVGAGDRWIVVDGGVYDVTRWQHKHPGGAKIIGHYAGQDATDAFHAMHPDLKLAMKFMKPILIGEVEKPAKQSKEMAMMHEFRSLRKSLEERGLFKASPIFFLLHFAHIVLLEAAAYLFLSHTDGGLGPFLITALILTVSQAQAGWTQHDYGHLSVFRSSKLNHVFHHITIGIFKAAGSHWWNFRHYQHHVKPNVFKKDPDITVPHLFLFGDKLPVKWGQQKRGKMPYNHQHHYFWLLGPVSLLPVYFHIENIYFVLKRKDWVDLLMTLIYFARFDYLFAGYYGSRLCSFALYMTMRVLESFWFTFVTQMSHLPMEVDEERNNNWLIQQTTATCNIEPSPFNDWFTGHLNYQIEHHLFPTMPRHNLSKISAEVQALCKKYDQPFVVKPLGTAFADIIRSLKHSGDLWHEAYNGF